MVVLQAVSLSVQQPSARVASPAGMDEASGICLVSLSTEGPWKESASRHVPFAPSTTADFRASFNRQKCHVLPITKVPTLDIGHRLCSWATYLSAPYVSVRGQFES